jgi:hypothetical protein
MIFGLRLNISSAIYIFANPTIISLETYKLTKKDTLEDNQLF